MLTRKKLTTALVSGFLAAGILGGVAVTATAVPAQERAASTVAGNYCGWHNGTKYADRGDRGNHVKEIQCLLVNWFQISVGPASVDGDFGKKTEDAVKTFQGRYGLTQDGRVGGNTWAKLRQG
ncbi:peptidoglycan-binding domain-containing protein [Streptomyces sp. NPDC002446]